MRQDFLTNKQVRESLFEIANLFPDDDKAVESYSMTVLPAEKPRKGCLEGVPERMTLKASIGNTRIKLHVEEDIDWTY